MTRSIFFLIHGIVMMLPSPAVADETNSESFDRRIAPLLAQRCLDCHNTSTKKGGLDLSQADGLRAGGDSGVAIQPGSVGDSLLWKRIDDDEMPPKNPLSAAEKASFRQWIADGANWGTDPIDAFRFTTDKRAGYDWWSLQPVVRSAVPRVKNLAWPRNEIDQFVLQKLEAAGLTPAPPADPRALIRRAYFDLIGLPPLLKDEDGKLKEELLGIEIDISSLRRDSSAFATIVNKLLDSPHYGERWGRHWLDVARYADSNGADVNPLHAHAWRYRDYVIAAFNNDLPWDQFLKEQIAGDLLPDANREERNRHWIATGFLAIGPKPLLKNDNELAEMDVVDEQIDTVGRAVLGLTLGCARCHDHKFDPLSARDYYALAGIFKSTQTVDRYDLRVQRTWTERALGSDADEALHLKLKREAEHEDDQRRLAGDDKPKADMHVARGKEVRQQLAKIAVAVAVREGRVADCAVHMRGNPETLGEVVPRGFPHALGNLASEQLNPEQSGRLQLAHWLTAPEHPLTTRVMVNRIWHWHFGEGIVRSPDNFGRMGQLPDHPELLDWLAAHFVESGWSVKAMHRLIMNSAAYQMGSQPSDAAIAVDPENRLLWRMNPRRLEAEEIRDAMLAVSGQLDLKTGGSLLPAGVNHEQADRYAKVIQQAYDSRRRAVYLPVIRSGMWEFYKVFNCPTASLTTGRRDATVVTAQALFMMNSDLMWRTSDSLATRLLAAPVGDDLQRVSDLYIRSFARPPDATESQRAISFLNQYKDTLGSRGITPGEADKLAWQAFCRSLLAANEFIYLE